MTGIIAKIKEIENGRHNSTDDRENIDVDCGYYYTWMKRWKNADVEIMKIDSDRVSRIQNDKNNFKNKWDRKW